MSFATREMRVVVLLVAVAFSGGACSAPHKFSSHEQGGTSGASAGAQGSPESMTGGGSNAGAGNAQAGSSHLGAAGQGGDAGDPDAGPQPATWGTSKWDDGSFFAP